MRVFVILAVLIVSAPALAEETLTCADARSVGLVWYDKVASPNGELTNFVPNRYAVTVVSEEERTVTDTAGVDKGKALKLTCRAVTDPRFPTLLSCRDSGGLYVWAFNGLRYTRASIFGPPLHTKVHNPDLVVAHGTCEKS
jgi:hypothetical protein